MDLDYDAALVSQNIITTTETTKTFKNPTIETEGSDEKDDLKNGIPAAGLMFFCLAPLPQFIKLCGMEGVPITQAIGAIYMAIYLLSVVTSLCPKPESPVDNVAVPFEEADTLKASDIQGLRQLSSTIYTLAIVMQFVIWIVLTLALAIVVINPGAGYLFGLLTPLVFALGVCATSYFCWSLVAWYYTIVFLVMQLAASKEGPSILSKPKEDSLALVAFYFYMWFGRILLMCAIVLVAAFGCWFLLARLEAGIKSLRNFSGETRPGKLERYHPLTEQRNGINTTAQSGQILTSDSHVRAQRTVSTTDTPEGPSSSTMQDQNDVELPLRRPDRLPPPFQVATPEVHPSESAVQQEESFNFEKWLEDNIHTVGEIGESPANPRPYGFPPDNRPGIRHAKARGMPYWVASVGGPATSPAAGTIYLNAEQQKIVKERLQFRQIELLSPLRQAEEKAKSSASFSVAFAIANLVIGLLCYIYKYNAEGTVKPDWTELLG